MERSSLNSLAPKSGLIIVSCRHNLLTCAASVRSHMQKTPGGIGRLNSFPWYFIWLVTNSDNMTVNSRLWAQGHKTRRKSVHDTSFDWLFALQILTSMFQLVYSTCMLKVYCEQITRNPIMYLPRIPLTMMMRCFAEDWAEALGVLRREWELGLPAQHKQP